MTTTNALAEISSHQRDSSLLCIGDFDLSQQVCGALAGQGWDVRYANDLLAAKQLLATRPCQVGLWVQTTNSDAPSEALHDFFSRYAALEWVGLFAPDIAGSAAWRELIVQHLFDHHTVPIDLPRILACLGHAAGRARLREQLATDDQPAADLHIVGTSPAMVDLLRRVKRAAKADAPVLLCGESGTGKELVAQAVHRYSPRAQAPFVAISCAAIPSSLIQSELFGHDKGGFTGATEARCGYFERANGGTLFLDEIADLSLELQANLLRFLQEGTISRVGSSRVLRLSVRVIAALHADVDEAMASGRLRHDLFYRLNVLPLRVPPLRERREDLPLLAQHFFSQFAGDARRGLKGFSKQAFSAMHAHDWPGNVRELMNRVRRAMILAPGRWIGPDDLGLDVVSKSVVIHGLDGARLSAERRAIESCLAQSNHKVAVAARRLGVSRMTLYRLLAKHGLVAGPNGTTEARPAAEAAAA